MPKIDLIFSHIQSFMQMSLPQELQLDQAAYSKTVQLISEVSLSFLIFTFSLISKMFLVMHWIIISQIAIVRIRITLIPMKTVIRPGSLQ